jgi:TatD DNase family protein
VLIDTHCHLNDRSAFPDPAEAVGQAREAGVTACFVVGVQPTEWAYTLELTERFDEVFAILGWHPNYTTGYDGDLEPLRELLSHPKVVALGEIGLDYHWDFSPREQQKRALADQLDLAAEARKPVVFHAREAYADLLDLLEARATHEYLLHCFSGTQEDARRAVELGCFFGIDGPITYKKSEELREIAAWLPRDRIVLETDSPYLTPVPYRGKPNQPAYLRLVNAALADCLGISERQCAELTTQNAARFFRVKLKGL